MARILTQWDFHRVQEQEKRSSDEEVMVVRSWRPTIKKNDNCVPPGNFLLHNIACCYTLGEFRSPKGSEFGYNYFKEICSPISLFYLNLNHSIRVSDGQVMAKTQS